MNSSNQPLPLFYGVRIPIPLKGDNTDEIPVRDAQTGEYFGTIRLGECFEQPEPSSR